MIQLGTQRAMPFGMLAATRQEEVLSYLPVVRRVVRRLRDRLPHMVDGEALEGAGVVGLLLAFDGFDPSKGVPFETYARIRIRGAIQDELRGLDHLTRRQRRRVRSIATAREAIQKRGHAPDDDAVAEGAELTLEQVEEASYLPTAPQSLDPSVLGQIALESPWQEPQSIEAALIEKEQRVRLQRALGELSEREQTIMSLYYKEDLTLQEIGEIFSVTQSRISQIISKIRRRLRTKLADA